MSLEIVQFAENLTIFYMFKRQYLRYANQHRRNLIINNGATRAFFKSMEDEDKALHWHSVQVYDELKKNISVLPPASLKVIFTEMQYFLDSVYQQIDVEYAKAGSQIDWFPCLPPIIPKLQNKIRREFLRLFPAKSQSGTVRKQRLTRPPAKSFEDLFYSPTVATQALSVLKKVVPAVINNKNKFLLDGCGAVSAWIEICKDNDYMLEKNRDVIAKILKKKLKGYGGSGKATTSKSTKEYFLYKMRLPAVFESAFK